MSKDPATHIRISFGKCACLKRHHTALADLNAPLEGSVHRRWVKTCRRAIVSTIVRSFVFYGAHCNLVRGLGCAGRRATF